MDPAERGEPAPAVGRGAAEPAPDRGAPGRVRGGHDHPPAARQGRAGRARAASANCAGCLGRPTFNLRPPVADFTGRAAEIVRTLVDALRRAASTPRLPARRHHRRIRGMGGIGKTELARVRSRRPLSERLSRRGAHVRAPARQRPADPRNPARPGHPRGPTPRRGCPTTCATCRRSTAKRWPAGGACCCWTTRRMPEQVRPLLPAARGLGRDRHLAQPLRAARRRTCTASSCCRWRRRSRCCAACWPTAGGGICPARIL